METNFTHVTPVVRRELPPFLACKPGQNGDVAHCAGAVTVWALLGIAATFIVGFAGYRFYHSVYCRFFRNKRSPVRAAAAGGEAFV